MSARNKPKVKQVQKDRLKKANVIRALENKSPLKPIMPHYFMASSVLGTTELNEIFEHIYDCLKIVWPED